VLGGPNALARFDRDVLAQPGARTLIVLEGINDIGFSDIPFPLPPAEPLTDVSVREITGAYRQIVARAHADGLRVLGGTLLPYKGSFYWSSRGEAKRQQLNAWIRASRALDAIIDFDRVMRNPANPPGPRASIRQRRPPASQ
jgi:lysophospholipase L1-like esterase